MEIGLTAAVGWLFLAIFAVLAIISILDLIKLIEIRSASQRKWLFNSVLGAAVLSVGGLGKAYYNDLIGQIGSPTPEATARPGPSGEPARPAGPVQQPSPSSEGPKADPSDAASNCAARAPEALRDWAQAELGERPDFACVARERYPRCVASLQGRAAAENSSIEARACAREIEAFRRNQISPVLARKGSYQVNLDSAEANSRSAGTPAELEHRDYVVAEIARMNGTEWQRFVTFDRDSLRDLGACNSAAKCTLPQ